MVNSYIGIDNGVSGSIAMIRDGEAAFMATPIYREQNYTKKKRLISRIHWVELRDILRDWSTKGTRVFIERPYTGARQYTVISGMRSLEATLIVIEMLHLSYEYVDSKQWQRLMLPKGLQGSGELKKASVDIGCRLFPDLRDAIKSHKDADSLLMAEWARRSQL